MQTTSNSNNLFSPECIKCVEVNGKFTNNTDIQDFTTGMENVRKLVNSLEKSIRKSNKYEERLIRCKLTHNHTHDGFSELWDTGASDQEYIYSTNKTSKNRFALPEALSTMSIVYLQFQYEELWKQYEVLFQAYNERCGAIRARDSTMNKLQQSLKRSNAQTIEAHQTLLSVGDKYLNLKRKRNEEKYMWERSINKHKEIVNEIMQGLEEAGLEFDTQLAQYLSEESDSDAAQLLAQMRKCNQLYLENLRLKTYIRRVLINNGN